MMGLTAICFEIIKQLSNISRYGRYARHYVICHLKIMNYLVELGINVFLALKKSKCSTSDGTWATKMSKQPTFVLFSYFLKKKKNCLISAFAALPVLK